MDIRKCKHCSEEFDISKYSKGWMANHTRWCPKNPKSKEYRKRNSNAIEAMNASKEKTGITNQFSKARLLGEEIPKSPLAGIPNKNWKGKKHTEKTKKIIRDKALASSHRRLKKGMIFYNGIWLDSSWELALAKRLDELEIKWIRPEPISWFDDENIKHNYFPDFYLVDYDIFLDPKNPEARKKQRRKIEILLTTYKNLVILNTLKECEEYEVR